jgi:hypothetical protein
MFKAQFQNDSDAETRSAWHWVLFFCHPEIVSGSLLCILGLCFKDPLYGLGPSLRLTGKGFLSYRFFEI